MTPKREKAIAILKNMIPPHLANWLETPQTDRFGGEIGELALTGVFDQLWTRPGLDLRTRSLITVAIMITLRAHSELAIYAGIAIRNGVTRSELEEVVYHATGYAGFPAAVSARDVIEKALDAAGVLDQPQSGVRAEKG